MTLIRNLASALCLALLCSSYSNSQTVDPTTGSLTNFTGAPTATTSVWNNAGSVGQPLTCWSGGDPGYCGPNPRVSAWGEGSNIINFSYGTTDLNQVVNINNALASSGSGVQLTGFNFGFQAKNGNGWDNGRQDYLSAYVKFYNSKGSVTENYDYTQSTNRQYNWTTFNFNETFATPYAPSKLSTAQYGFIGRDNNFWVGPYGPEITNVSFSLKYSVKPDPCIADPLSSATCPGYALATVKNSLLGSTVSNASATSFVPPPSGPQGLDLPPGQGPQPGPGPAGGNNQGQGPMQGQSLMEQGPMQAQGPVGGNGPQQGSGASGGNNQGGGQGPQQAQGPAAGPAQGPESNKPGVSTSQALSMISANAAKESNLAISISNSAISQASSAGDKATQDAQKVAATSSAQSMETSQAATSSATTTAVAAPGSTSVVQIGAFRLPGTTNTGGTQSFGTEITMQAPMTMTMGNTSSFRTDSTTQEPVAMAVSNTPSFRTDTLIQSTAESSNTSIGLRLPTRNQTEIESPRINEELKVSGINPLLTSSNAGITQAAMTETKSESVKKNVQENSAAGGVLLTAIATVPVGYNAYFSAIVDSAFYAPKEIYKNQRVVDNARTQRLLNGASDKTYEQMLEQQYQPK